MNICSLLTGTKGKYLNVGLVAGLWVGAGEGSVLCSVIQPGSWKPSLQLHCRGEKLSVLKISWELSVQGLHILSQFRRGCSSHGWGKRYMLLTFCATVFFSCSPSYSISEGMAPTVGSYGSTPQPIPRFQHPSHELLQENGFTQQLYSKYHNKCLKGLSVTVLFS